MQRGSLSVLNENNNTKKTAMLGDVSLNKEESPVSFPLLRAGTEHKAKTLESTLQFGKPVTFKEQEVNSDNDYLQSPPPYDDENTIGESLLNRKQQVQHIQSSSLPNQ